METPDEIFTVLMRGYEEQRARDQEDLNERKLEIYRKLPRIEEIDRRLESTGLRIFNAARTLSREDYGKTLESIKGENEALAAEKATLLADAGYPADALELRFRCPDCKDTGFIGDTKCHCLKQAQMSALYKNSNLEKLLQKENFDTFDFNVFSDRSFPGEEDSPRENAKRIHRAVMDYIWHFGENPKSGLLLYGTPGSGKTFFASSIAKEIMDQGHSVLYVSAYDLLAAYETRRFSGRQSDADLDKAVTRCEMAQSCDLLIIDDLGTEFSNSMTVSDLFHCINTRLNEGKATVISTNLMPNQLSQRYTERLGSRILGEFIPLKFYGPDLRLKR